MAQISCGAHAPVVDLPPLIQTALARIMGCDGGGLADLTYRERSLLARITRNVSTKAPTDSVRVSVANLAGALQTCGRTIQRTFNGLREKGWITRDQVKRRSGMEIADTWLTPMALELLGLARPVPSRAASDKKSGVTSLSSMSKDSQQVPGLFEKNTEQPAATDLADETLVDEDPSNVAKTPQEASEAATVTEATTNELEAPTGLSDETPASNIPADLKLLQQIGMKPGAVFKLMGEATRAGHRLGQIVRAAGPLIRAANRPFSYIRKLISHDRDWSSYTSASVLREQEAAKQAPAGSVLAERPDAREVDRVEVLQALGDGKRLVNAAGTRVMLLIDGQPYVCSRDALDRPDWRHHCSHEPRIPAIAQAIRDGKWTEFQPDSPAPVAEQLAGPAVGSHAWAQETVDRYVQGEEIAPDTLQLASRMVGGMAPRIHRSFNVLGQAADRAKESVVRREAMEVYLDRYIAGMENDHDKAKRACLGTYRNRLVVAAQRAANLANLGAAPAPGLRMA